MDEVKELGPGRDGGHRKSRDKVCRECSRTGKRRGAAHVIRNKGNGGQNLRHQARLLHDQFDIDQSFDQ